VLDIADPSLLATDLLHSVAFNILDQSLLPFVTHAVRVPEGSRACVRLLQLHFRAVRLPFRADGCVSL
jgi:hypothetical protein